jgi:hypothetical protein
MKRNNLIPLIMKKSILISLAIIFTLPALAQTNAIDEMFDKYSDRDGYTSVFISGKMLNMIGQLQSDEEKSQTPFPKITGIRILTTDSLNLGRVNFYNELSKKIDFSAYEELMVVKEQKEVTKFLVRQSGNTISELLLITGGSGRNTLISIRGDINLKQLSQISKSVGIEELDQLDKLEKKPGK